MFLKSFLDTFLEDIFWPVSWTCVLEHPSWTHSSKISGTSFLDTYLGSVSATIFLKQEKWKHKHENTTEKTSHKKTENKKQQYSNNNTAAPKRRHCIKNTKDENSTKRGGEKHHTKKQQEIGTWHQHSLTQNTHRHLRAALGSLSKEQRMKAEKWQGGTRERFCNIVGGNLWTTSARQLFFPAPWFFVLFAVSVADSSCHMQAHFTWQGVATTLVD